MVLSSVLLFCVLYISISISLSGGQIDEVVAVHSTAAEAMCARLWLEEGLPLGVSAGAIVAAACEVWAREGGGGHRTQIIPAPPLL